VPDLASLFVFPFFLVFFRVAAAVMVFPALSDPSVNPRTRLLIAGGIALILWPMVGATLPALPETISQLAMYIIVELVLGLMMGIAARLFMSAMSVAGEMIAFSTGFQAATLFDPISNTNTTAPTLFLLITAGVLVLASNLHHVLIEGIMESYQLFPPGTLPPVGDVAQAVVGLVRDLFYVGLKIAAPVVVVGFLGYVAFGIFNRLIPQLHVFFVALPLTIVVGMFVLASALSLMLTLFVTELHNHVMLFNQTGIE
jgi:flagellar biosynthetic protein FliR